MKLHIVITLFILLPMPAVYASESGSATDNPDWVWFFYEKSEDSSGSSVIYRPFFMETVSPDLTFQASLMPLFFTRYITADSDSVNGFFDFYQSSDYLHTGKQKDYDAAFFPLFMYGSGTDLSDNYLLVYPFGGTMKGKFGYDRISPYIFPGVVLFFIFPPSSIFTFQTLLLGLAALVPAYTEFEEGDYSATAILWPLITWGGSESGKRSDFRFLPFYSHNRKEGWYENWSYLFICSYREMYLKDDTRYTFFLLPLFGRKWSREGRVSSYTVLWPFFSWGYDSGTNDREYNLPWPLVQIRDCDNPRVKKRIFFPFYGTYSYENYDSLFVTPLYFRINSRSERENSVYHIAGIIFWYFEREYSYNHEFYGRSWSYFKFWPLLQVEWSDSGFYSLNILSLLPFRDTAGYERLYQPFWTLFEYRVKPGGQRHLGLLLRTYYQVWDSNLMKIKVPLLFNYTSWKGGLRELCFIAHAFGYERDSSGAYVRIFWIPLRVGDGVDDKGEKLADEEDAGNGCISDEWFNSMHGNLNCCGTDGNLYASVRF